MSKLRAPEFWGYDSVRSRLGDVFQQVIVERPSNGPAGAPSVRHSGTGAVAAASAVAAVAGTGAEKSQAGFATMGESD